VSVTYLPAAVRRQVDERADGRCEYCRLAETDAFFAHEPDHIISEKHDGDSTIRNLALSCFDCNRFKGSDIASLDPLTSALVPLFNPRIHDWQEHFTTDAGLIIPQTPTGRATEKILKLNLPARVEVRSELAVRGLWP
jgi:HNH endonuclease